MKEYIKLKNILISPKGKIYININKYNELYNNYKKLFNLILSKGNIKNE